MPPNFAVMAEELFIFGLKHFPGLIAARLEIITNTVCLAVIDRQFSSRQVICYTPAYDRLMTEKVLVMERNRFLNWELTHGSH